MARCHKDPRPVTAIAMRLIEKVEALGVSDAWLCERAGVGVNAMQRLRAGKHPGMSAAIIDKLASAIGCEVAIVDLDDDAETREAIRIERERHAAFRGFNGYHVPEVKRPDWNNLKKKGFSTAEIAGILDLQRWEDYAR